MSGQDATPLRSTTTEVAQSESAVPLYERPGRELGSTWTQRPRACENCENEHQALIDWTDGSKLCVTCSQIRRKNLRIAALGGGSDV